MDEVFLFGRDWANDFDIDAPEFSEHYTEIQRMRSAYPTTTSARPAKTVHHCIGSHLARLEPRVALEESLAGLPSFRLKHGAQLEYETGVLRTMKSLPLAFEPVREVAA